MNDFNEVKVLGKYELLCSIGSGGSGDVAKAVDENGVEVAVKMIPSTNGFDFQAYYYRAERDILKQLNHPNIANLLESGEENGNGFLVLELGPNGTLADALEKRHNCRFSEADVLKVAKQLLTALVHIHERGVTHYDITMKNIVVMNDDLDVKLIDFGMSSQERAEHVCSMQDIYDCGTVLYAMTYGEKTPLNRLKKVYDVQGNESWKPMRESTATIEPNARIVFPTEPEISQEVKELLQTTITPGDSTTAAEIMSQHFDRNVDGGSDLETCNSDGNATNEAFVLENVSEGSNDEEYVSESEQSRTANPANSVNVGMCNDNDKISSETDRKSGAHKSMETKMARKGKSASNRKFAKMICCIM